MSFIKVKKVIDMLTDAGFYLKSQKGSHMKYEHPDGRTVIVPNHNSKGIEKGTYHNILRQAGLK
ncbi:MAG: type II toxin-antitoxin system HicA family toxin [Bacteroidales bacterium]